jgi:hypothetical protein
VRTPTSIHSNSFCDVRVFDGKWPPFSAYVALELWKSIDSPNHYVRVVYNGQPLVCARF